MFVNYGLLLLIATFLTGGIVLLDRFILKPNTNFIFKTHKNNPVIEGAKVFFPILLVILVVRSFIFEPFRIPSDSMNPTLQSGDFILVDKFSYGVILPGIRTPLYQLDKPRRGDVSVFRDPINPDEYYVKRVIGIPGDKVIYADKNLLIEQDCQNKALQDNCKTIIQVKKEKSQSDVLYMKTDLVYQYQEAIEKKSYTIYESSDSDKKTDNFTVIVPENHYFVMGDYRDKSIDSRDWGVIAEKNFIGKASYIWLHIDYNNDSMKWLPTSLSFKSNGRIQ